MVWHQIVGGQGEVACVAGLNGVWPPGGRIAWQAAERVWAPAFERLGAAHPAPSTQNRLLSGAYPTPTLPCPPCAHPAQPAPTKT